MPSGYIPYQSRIWGSYTASDSSVYESDTSLLPPFGATTGSWKTDEPLQSVESSNPKTDVFLLEGDYYGTGKERSSYAYSYGPMLNPIAPFTQVPQCIAKDPIAGSTPSGTTFVSSDQDAKNCVDTLNDNGIIAWHNPTDIAYDAYFFTAVQGYARLASLFPVTTYAWRWNGSQYISDSDYQYDCRNPGNSSACSFAGDVGWDTKFDANRHKVNINNMIINYVTESVDIELTDPTFKTGRVVRLAFDVEANPDQLPIKKIEVNWGDGNRETLSALRDINNSRVEVTHTYQKTPEECGTNDGCWIEDGKFKVVVDAVDNWCWTTRGYYTPGDKSCWFDNVKKDSEITHGSYTVFQLINVIAN